MTDNILKCSVEKIKQVLSREDSSRRVLFMNEIFNTTACGSVGKSPDEMRDLLAALCDFTTRYSFFIPQNWMEIGKSEFNLQGDIK